MTRPRLASCVLPRMRARTFRRLVNFLPAVRGMGVRVTHIADDWSTLRVRLPLNLRTRNYVGTIFGGSMYGACDPWFMLMLIHRLGDRYIVWDKAATIRFRRPGRETLHAEFHMPDAEVDAIRQALETDAKTDRTYHARLVDADGVVHAEVEKVVHVRRRDAV